MAAIICHALSPLFNQSGTEAEPPWYASGTGLGGREAMVLGGFKLASNCYSYLTCSFFLQYARPGDYKHAHKVVEIQNNKNDEEKL